MKLAVRNQVVRVLEATAMRLMAGTITYPPKMYEDIIKRVEQQFMNWTLFISDEYEKDLQGKLDLVQGKEGVEFPQPTFSPAIWKMVRTQAEILLDIKAGKEPTVKLAKRSSNQEIMVQFLRSLSGRSRFGYGDEKPGEVTEPVLKQLEVLKSAKNMKGLDDAAMKTLGAVLWTVAYTSFSAAAEKAARILNNYQSEKKDFENRQQSPVGDDPTKTGPLLKTLKSVQELRKYLEQRGAKAETPHKKRPKNSKRKGGAKAEWKIPVDLSGLPPKYPVESAKDLKEITVSFQVARAKFAGAWSDTTHKLYNAHHAAVGHR
jgi:hypothetical protein